MIGIPALNEEANIGILIDSLLKQKQEGFSLCKIVIASDGSTDDTSQVARGLIEKYPDLSLTLVEQENRGLPAARNTGIAVSKGEFWLPLDADDRIAPTFVEKCVRALENLPKVGFAYSDIQHFGELDTIFRLPIFDADAMVHTNNIGCVCSLVRKQVWLDTGGYNEEMKQGYEDWDFWVSCIEKGWQGIRIPDPLFYYRKRKHTMLTDANRERDVLIARIVLNHPALYSVERIPNAVITLPRRIQREIHPVRVTESLKNRPRLTITYLIQSVNIVTGGTQTLLKQVNALVARGHSVTVLTYSEKPPWFDIKANLVRVPEGTAMAAYVPTSDVVVSSYFLNTHELLDVDALVKMYYAQGDQYVFWRKSVAQDQHKNVNPQSPQSMSAASYGYPDVRFVANSLNLANTVKWAHGRTADAILPVCTDQTVFKPAPNTGSDRSKRIRILVVGSDRRGSGQQSLDFKGMSDIRKAVDLLEERGLSFLVVRMANSPADIFKGYPCEYHYCPSDSIKTGLFGSADILIYASHYDSCPRPPQEAMASGTAVVCTATPGALEYCRHRQNSLLVPVANPKAIADALELLIKDKGLRARLVKGGLVTAAEYPREREWDELEHLLYRFKDAAEGRDTATGKDTTRLGSITDKLIHNEPEIPVADIYSPETVSDQRQETEKMRTSANSHDEKNVACEEFRSAEKIYEKAKSLVDDGDSKNAVAVLESILERYEDFALAHNDLGVLYYQAGDMQAAVHHYEKAVEIEPANKAFRKNLADFYCIEQGRIEEAMRMYVDLLAVEPDDIEVLMSMGLICAALERPEDARHFYNRVLGAEPWNVDARQQLEKLKLSLSEKRSMRC